MRQSEFLKRLATALGRVDASIASSGRHDRVAAGLSSEGYSGGYRDALLDVDALLRHGNPRDDRGYWRQEGADADRA